MTEYCPNPAEDFEMDEGSSVTWTRDGWSIKGKTRVASKASFDFSGGGAWWDMDLSGAHKGVNNNFYVTYPYEPNCGGSCYCDSGGNHDSQGRGCAELDWTENNGNCYAATTWHDAEDGSEGGGYGSHTNLGGGVNSYSAVYSADGGHVDITVNGNKIGGNGQTGSMKARGAVIYSSQWTGWVPGDWCGNSGDLWSSVYTVKNLKITGRVVQGPEPTKCHPDTPAPTPRPTPPPAPRPTPAPTRPGGCEDKNAFCHAWAAQGECKSNPGYMLIVCKLSCGVCGVRANTSALVV